MKEYDDIMRQSAQLRTLMEARLGVRASTLDQALRKAGRQLPRGVQAQGRVLSDAERLAGNPKLLRQLDRSRLAGAFETVASHLRAIDVADRRKGRILNMLGVIAFNLLVIMVAFIVWLWWRGYV